MSICMAWRIGTDIRKTLIPSRSTLNTLTITVYTKEYPNQVKTTKQAQTNESHHIAISTFRDTLRSRSMNPTVPKNHQKHQLDNHKNSARLSFSPVLLLYHWSSKLASIWRWKHAVCNEHRKRPTFCGQNCHGALMALLVSLAEALPRFTRRNNGVQALLVLFWLV